jgi:hypothetical protein
VRGEDGRVEPRRWFRRLRRGGLRHAEPCRQLLKRDDLDPLVRLEIAQVGVFADDTVGVTFERTREKIVVIRIGFDLLDDVGAGGRLRRDP